MIPTPADLAVMRADQLAMLTDVGEVRHPPEWVDVGGISTLTAGPVATVWKSSAIPCRIVDPEYTDARASVGDQDVTVRHLIVTLPWDVTGTLAGLTMHVMSSTDPGLIGKDLTLQADIHHSLVTGRRVRATMNLTPPVM